jgi:hypothetical protein
MATLKYPAKILGKGEQFEANERINSIEGNPPAGGCPANLDS